MSVAKSTPVQRTKLSDQIYDLIYQRIITGQYPAESKLPTEHELARDFHASRPVVREALSALREDGFVVSRERVGNFVTSPGVNCGSCRWVASPTSSGALPSVSHWRARLRFSPPAIARKRTSRQSPTRRIISIAWSTRGNRASMPITPSTWR